MLSEQASRPYSYASSVKDLYQVWETFKKLFSSVLADRADLGSTKTAEQKLKYATI